MSAFPRGVRVVLGGGKSPTGELTRARGLCAGWTAGASKRFLELILSLVFPPGTWICAFTLTIDSFPSSERMTRMRRLWEARVKRRHGDPGFLWLREWQREGRQHFHGIMVWYPPVVGVVDPMRVLGVFGGMSPVQMWCEVARRNGIGASRRYQRVEAMTHDGWLRYCMRHFLRGVHYQRQPSKRRDSGGRVWGHSGLGRSDSLNYELTREDAFRLRRMLVGLARARWKRPERDPAVSTRARRRGGEVVRSRKYHSPLRLAPAKVSPWLSFTGAFISPAALFRFMADGGGFDLMGERNCEWYREEFRRVAKGATSGDLWDFARAG